MTVANDVRVAIYEGFIEHGRAPTNEEIGRHLGLRLDEVRGGLNELAASDVIAFHPGTEDLWLAHPFCATDGPFTVAAGSRRWDAICIWDALGILVILGTDGEVTTACPDCREPLTVSVVGGAVSGPDDHVVHFGVPARSWYEDVGYT